jgi:aryl-alcohol dehydrogenase-like predicted oxidoreductase
MTAIESRRLGATGLSVSKLGFGGAPIGFAAGGSRAEFVRLVRRACELGITFFDTAPDYRDSEGIIGEALADARGAGAGGAGGAGGAATVATVATKVGRRQELRGGEWHVTEDWSRDTILRSIERSLEALRTDVLDLVQLHSPSIEVLRRGDAQRTLELARDRGLVRHVGLSADGADAEVALDVGGFETLQISYNVVVVDSVTELIERASEAGLGIIVKQPIANGSLGQDTQRALRWLLSDERLSTAIVGTTRIEHLEANVAAAAIGPGVAQATRA